MPFTEYIETRVGGWAVGLERQWALYASATPAFLTRADDDRLPDMVDCGDWSIIEDQANQGACFPAGTLVTMHDGSLLPIEQIQFGHRVQTHNGRSRQVVDTMQRLYTGDMVSIKAKGWASVVATADHRFYVVRDGERHWIPAAKIRVGDQVAIGFSVDKKPTDFLDLRDYVRSDYSSDGETIAAYNSPTWIPWKLPLDELTCWVIGLYVAEGCTYAQTGGSRSRTTWTLHQNEAEYASRIELWCGRLGLPVCSVFKPDSLAASFSAACPILAEFLHLACGHGADRKRIPEFIMQGTAVQKVAFLRGYMAGDGSTRKLETGRIAKSGNLVNCHQIASSTISRVLWQQLGLVMNSVGMKASLSAGNLRKGRRLAYHNYIYGRDACKFAGIKPQYKHGWEDRRQNTTRPENDRAGQLRKVIEVAVNPVESVPVYDFEVAEDHSFYANGVAVHNCQGHDLSTCVESLDVRMGGPLRQLSRAQAYYETQRLDGIRGDSGSTIEGGIRLATETGLCLESDWPYPSSYNPQRPAGYDQAPKFKIAGHVIIRDWDSAIRHLGLVGPISIGIMWGGEIDRQVSNNGIIQSYSGSGGGGHAIALLGYRKTHYDGSQLGEIHIDLYNSWSKRWGKNGRCLVSRRAFEQMLAQRWTVMAGIIGLPQVVRPDY